MSEFDTAAFSAIDKFFGEDVKDTGDIVGKGSKAIPSSQHPKGKRRGVGSAAAPTLEVPYHELSKKLLKVGRKRQRRGNDGDDGSGDDDDEGDAAETERQGGGEEDEGGRTAIAPRESLKKVDGLTTVSKKKKLNKKERMKKQEDGQEQAKEGIKVNQPRDDSQISNDTKESMLIEGEPPSNGNTAEKKQKRRKVRSKQKNIRKDNRNTKPDHLIVGQKKYQGRPLTAETRAVLHLPAPKLRAPHVVQSPHDDEMGIEGAGLAIDDLLEDSGEQVEKTPCGEMKKKSNKNPKKPRYKNLKV